MSRPTDLRITGGIEATHEIIKLDEWGETDQPIDLSDRALDWIQTTLNKDQTRIGFQYTRDGDVYLSARQFVGVVSLPDGPTIQITPKAAGGNLLHMLRYAREVTPTTLAEQTGLKQGGTFIDALAALFNRELSAVLQRGLFTEYQTQTATEPRLRGRLDLQRQFQRQGPTPTGFECEYEELTPNTVANRAILYATVVLSRLTTDADLRRDLDWHASRLRQHVTLTPVRPAALKGLETTRLNDYYTELLRLVEPVLRNAYVENVAAGGRQSFSLLMNMNTIYERVIERAVTAAVPDTDAWTVKGQATTTNLLSGQPSVRLRPDVQINHHDEPVVVGDAKWKTGSVRNADIYQVVAYMLAHETPGVLLYPAQSGTLDRTYQTSIDEPLSITSVPTDIDVGDSYDRFISVLEDAVQDRLEAVAGPIDSSL